MPTMPRSRRQFPLAEIEANLTPMIDVSFLLIVFFALVSGASKRDQAPLDLARVRAGAAVKPEQSARWVVNVLPAPDGAAAGYAVNGAVLAPTPEGLERLAGILADGYRANPGLAINLRADRATAYRFVEPAMRAATTGARLAGGGALPRLNLVVEEAGGAGDVGAGDVGLGGVGLGGVGLGGVGLGGVGLGGVGLGGVGTGLQGVGFGGEGLGHEGLDLEGLSGDRLARTPRDERGRDGA